MCVLWSALLSCLRLPARVVVAGIKLLEIINLLLYVSARVFLLCGFVSFVLIGCDGVIAGLTGRDNGDNGTTCRVPVSFKLDTGNVRYRVG